MSSMNNEQVIQQAVDQLISGFCRSFDADHLPPGLNEQVIRISQEAGARFCWTGVWRRIVIG